MKVEAAVDRVLLGESMQCLAESYREQLLVGLGLNPEECEDALFLKETHKLRTWVRVVEDYDAYDALLSNYRFEGRDVVIRRGRMLFPGPLTAHWE